MKYFSLSLCLFLYVGVEINVASLSATHFVSASGKVDRGPTLGNALLDASVYPSFFSGV